jgi:hypothetical protein
MRILPAALDLQMGVGIRYQKSMTVVSTRTAGITVLDASLDRRQGFVP